MCILISTIPIHSGGSLDKYYQKYIDLKASLVLQQ